MSQREWMQFVKDAKVPIPITEINDVFRCVDRAEKDAKAKDPKAKADKQMVLAEFLEALVRTAAKLMSTSKAAKAGLMEGKLGEGFEKLIHTYVLPLAVRPPPHRTRLPHPHTHGGTCGRTPSRLASRLGGIGCERRRTETAQPLRRPRAAGAGRSSVGELEAGRAVARPDAERAERP
jgi:hypothetical protein